MQLNRAHWMLTAAVTGLLATQLYAAADRTATIQYTATGEVRLPGYRRWVFIGSGAFDSPQTAPAPRSSNVYAGAVDSTFVQFYPLLLPVAQQARHAARSLTDRTPVQFVPPGRSPPPR